MPKLMIKETDKAVLGRPGNTRAPGLLIEAFSGIDQGHL